jgi:hypothetical protein
MVIAGAGGASANIAWCAADPAVHVDTEGGANLTVNTTVSVLQTEVSLLSDLQVDAVMTSDGSGGTNIAVSVQLPAGISSAYVTAKVKRYHVSATTVGYGGTTVTLYLHVPVA